MTSSRPPRPPGCELQLDLEEEGGTHFSDENRVPDYGTNPPTSGDHYANAGETGAGALADGAYLNAPPVARTVHSMEHGRVLIQYSPELPERDQLEIKGVFEESPPGVLLFPNPDMPLRRRGDRLDPARRLRDIRRRGDA